MATPVADAARRYSRLGRQTALVVLALSALWAVLAGAALAAPGHVLGGRINTLLTDPPGFSGPSGIAVQQSNQDVFVVDAGNGRIVQLDSAGVFQGSFTAGLAPDAASAAFTAIASDGSSGDLYVVDPANGGDRPNGAVDRFNADGTYVSQINETDVPAGTFFPSSVAVNPTNGNVYVADGAGIDVFDSTGTFQSQITGAGSEGPLSSTTAVAVDNAGNVYVIDGSNVSKFAPDGTFLSFVLMSFGAQAITVDPATGDLFILDGSTGVPRVLHYDSSGTLLFTFGTNDIVSSSSLAVDATSGRVYVADQGNSDIPFFDAAVAPDVTTGAATPTTEGGMLSGTVDPLGFPTSYHFDYGADESYGSSTADVDAGTGTGNVDAAATLTGLAPNTTFHYRLVASNASISNFGADQAFTTSPVPPTVTTLAATDVTRNAATLNATVNPNNSQTTYHFEYGLSTAYGSTTPDADGGAGGTADPRSAPLVGLEPATEYHFRVVADNGTGGPQLGDDQTFTTLAPLAEVTVGAATGVTQTSAVLHATVNNHGFPSTYQFVLEGIDNAHLAATPVTDLAAVDGPQQVSALVSGLPIGKSFQARLFAITEGGTSFTDFSTFKTLDNGYVAPPPPLPDLAPYGCVAPHLNAHTAKAKAGKTITLTGSDLGVGGVVSFGSTDVDTSSWSSTAVKAQVPAGVKGTYVVKLNCSTESNAIKVAIAKPKPKAKKCKKGYVKKKVKGKTRCVKKKSSKKK
jgi:DNA-binding beta-propeller fold protein YncE